MNPIRPEDLVMLKHTPSWQGLVTYADVELHQVMVAHPVAAGLVVAWIPLDFLELVPGQMESMRA